MKMNIIRLLRQDLVRLSEDYEQKTASVQYWKIIHPRFFPVIIIRLSHFFYQSVWLRPLSYILVWVNLIIFGIEVTPRCSIGGGLFLPHTSGTVIGAASIGENVTIFQGVTIGTRHPDLLFNVSNRPIIEDGVMLGAGSKVLGGIIVGAGASVASNSLAIDSVPACATVIGVPASIKV